MNNDCPPLTYDEALSWAKYAGSLPRSDADIVQRGLMKRYVESRCTSLEVWGVINSITDRFVEEDRDMRRKLMMEDLRRRGIVEQEHIEADDDQIVQAVKWTLPKFQSDWDWGGVYRILVDFCDFPATKTDFVKRFARMGIYPKDNSVKDFERNMPPAIRRTEWCEHQFSYQAIQKGVNPNWPSTYYEWKKSELANRDFTDRRDIAALFLKNLVNATEQQDCTKVY